VRELRNVLERAMLTLRGTEIRSEDLILDTAASVPASGLLPTAEWDIRPLDEMISKYVAAVGGKRHRRQRAQGRAAALLTRRFAEENKNRTICRAG
jgi:DNA-binding NtrC family response regulator